MPYKPNEVITVLLNKLQFAEVKKPNPDHAWYELQLEGIPRIRTKVSHNKKDIPTIIEGMITRQLRIRKSFFEEVMRCTKSREEYYKQVTENPVPPWDVRI